jgi:TonB family protein
MYFDFEDYRPDISPVGRAISWREGILISIIAHMAMIILLLLAPKLFPFDEQAARARAAALEQQLAREKEKTRFVFVQPRVDLKALKPPARADASDADRLARSLEQAKKPDNPLPFSRGNTRERVEETRPETARGRGPAPDPSPDQQALAQPQDQPPADTTDAPKLPPSSTALPLPSARAPQISARAGGGSLGEALRNLDRYVQSDQFENSQGSGAFGPAIQFDTKGVEFGPWIRRFVQQVKRNWLIPMAVMSMSGHVVITFNVHKNGALTDLTIAGPCPVEAFNHAAYGALVASNPTAPLPPEYPSDTAFFTVTFFYNEDPR